MGFSFGEDREAKLIGPRSNNMGQAPPHAAQKRKHQLCNPAQDCPFPYSWTPTANTWLYLKKSMDFTRVTTSRLVLCPAHTMATCKS